MPRPLVLSLHGIRTRGVWQKDLTIAVNEAGFDHIPIDYGFFSSLQLISPGARRKRVDWFRDEYERAMRGRKELPSIVAHSFGTYIVTEAMRIYPEVRFDQVILCGSIVRPDYPWSEVIGRGAAARVLNDYGHLDTWAKLVAWGVTDAGPSGVRGFEDKAGGAVVERAHPDWRHSDFFYASNFKENWLPFLSGGLPGAAGTKRPPGCNPRPAIVAAALLIALVTVGVFVWRPARKTGPAAPVSIPVEWSYVSGKVVDELSLRAVENATVEIVGGERGKTDRAGVFNLRSRSGNAVLVVTRDGYADAKVNVSAPTSLTIALRKSSS